MVHSCWESFIKRLFTKVCVQDLGIATRDVGVLQWGAVTKSKCEGGRGERVYQNLEFLERGARQDSLCGGMQSTHKNYQEKILGKNFLTSLCSCPLISCRYSPLAEPKWKPEGKGTLDAVYTGRQPGQRADGEEGRVDPGGQKVLSTATQHSEYVNQ